MKKSKLTFLLILTVIALGILIVGTNAAAVENCGPDLNQMRSITVAKNGSIQTALAPDIYLKFFGVFPVKCDGNCVVPDGTYYRWVYQTQHEDGTWNNIAVNDIQFLVPQINIPDQCDLNNQYFFSGSNGLPESINGHIFDSGNYEENPYWRFVYERQIISSTRDDSSIPPGISGNVYSFYTKYLSKAKVMSLYIKSGNNEYIVQTLGPSQAEEPPKIETSCEQIKKNSDPPQCVYACYQTENGVMTKIVSADLYESADCAAGTFVRALRIFEPNDPNKMLICNPCDNAGSLPGAPTCVANEDQNNPPFRIGIGTDPVMYKNCDEFKKDYQSLGVTLEIGEDPCRVLRGTSTCW